MKKRQEEIEARLQQQREAIEKEHARQLNEFRALGSPNEILDWLRKELKSKNMAEGRIVPAMDSDKSGTITFREFTNPVVISFRA